jgi:hypothetical protein
MAEIKIDSKLFQERISHFVTAWKNDLRSKDSLFNGAQSLIVMMGKVEEIPEFHKNNAIHVCDPFPRNEKSKIGLEMNTYKILVLAPWIRVSYNINVIYAGHAVHSHNGKKRCACRIGCCLT